MCPVYKTGNKNIFTNYRPISILPRFSKVFEKVVLNRLINYVEKKNILSCNQYEFREEYSTYMAIVDMCNKITTAIDNNEYAVGIFIDLSRAFDTLNHNILLKKLEHYGIRGIALQWFCNYLSNRKQYVYINGTSSYLRDINCGIPQGSILAPLLFVLYLNDITHCSDLLKFILFADDTNLFHSSKHLSQLTTSVNCELCKLCDWFCSNRLSLNAKKTNYILFGFKSQPHVTDRLDLYIDGIAIDQVEYSKFLGVYLDSKMNWKKHIEHIKLKISRGLGVMSRVRKILPLNVMTMLYHTLIYPYLVYCNICWGSAKTSNISKIAVLQKRAVRLCSGSGYMTPSNPVFVRLNLLKLADIHNLQIAIFMFKLKFRQLPTSFHHYASITNIDRFHNTRHISYFIQIKSRTNIHCHSITVHGPRLWDSLPMTIQQSNVLSAFKSSLHNHYVSLYSS